jgi:hypothetical protein
MRVALFCWTPRLPIVVHASRLPLGIHGRRRRTANNAGFRTEIPPNGDDLENSFVLHVRNRPSAAYRSTNDTRGVPLGGETHSYTEETL